MSEEIAIITAEQMKNLIYLIRGHKVMLDVDLAEIYGYTTKAFNQQVKRNIEKFDNDFMFQLTEQEVINLRSQNVTSSWGGTRYLPYAFTEQGIYMLMTVLKGDLAIKQSKALIRLFKSMKDYIAANTLISADDFLKLSIQTCENTSAISRIENETLKKSDLPNIIKAFSTEQSSEYLFMNGELCKAALAYQRIYNKAKKSIYIIDDYISIDTLMRLKHISSNVKIVIISDNKQKYLRLTEYKLFTEEYPDLNITFKQTNNVCHDRYIILDYGTKSEKIYHCGASSKDAGKKVTTIAEVQDTNTYKTMVDTLMQHEALLLN